MKPAIILKTDFVAHTEKDFSNYINYIDRDGAKNRGVEEIKYDYDDNSYEDYLEYMNRPSAKYTNKKEEGEGLFSNKKDLLNSKERKDIKKRFKDSQEKGTVLWRDIYSFDNEWLTNNGFLKDGLLEEKSIKDATRKAMEDCFKREGLTDTGYWVGEIHYNTDNIHVHIASTETKNTRPIMEYVQKKRNSNGDYDELISSQPRGKRKPSTEDSMKSTFINHLADRDNTLERLSTLRYELHHAIKVNPKSIDQKKILKDIKSQLPADRKHWLYNHYSMKNLKEPINEYTHQYMNMYHKKEFDEYKELLKKDSELNKSLYGVGKKKRFKDSYENKMNDLNSKMGNALLRTIKESEKKLSKEITINHEIHKNSRTGNSNISNNSKMKFKMNGKNNITKYDLYGVQKAFRDHRREHELESQSKQLEQKIQNENQNEL